MKQDAPCIHRRAMLVRAAGALAVAAGGTPAAAQPLVVKDDRGIEVRLQALPQRWVSLMPSLTEIAWVLGAGARLVGVDRYSNWPAEVEALPRLGGLDDAHIEAIVRLKPDVVLAAHGARALDRLETLGLRVLRLKSDSHADVRRAMGVVARLMGTPAEGERAWARIDARLDAAAARMPPAFRGQTVYFELGAGPYAAGASSFIGQTLQRLGLINVVPESLGPFPRLSPEFVVRARPAIVMGSRREQTTLAQRPGWGALPAVQSARLCGFDSPTYEMMTRPGPRLADAADAVVDCLSALERSGRT